MLRAELTEPLDAFIMSRDMIAGSKRRKAKEENEASTRTES